MNLTYIVIGALLLVAFYALAVYNALQTLKTQIVASIQEIGNQLKRQANLIPNLQESVKAYMKHEKGIFKDLTDARKSVDAAMKRPTSANVEKAASSLQSILPKFQVIVESNPQLKANETVMSFMNELRDTADKLMYSRRTLIDLTQDYNMRLVTMPSALVAKLFGFKPEKGLSTPMTGTHVAVSEDETKDVKVSM